VDEDERNLLMAINFEKLARLESRTEAAFAERRALSATYLDHIYAAKSLRLDAVRYSSLPDESVAGLNKLDPVELVAAGVDLKALHAASMEMAAAGEVKMRMDAGDSRLRQMANLTQSLRRYAGQSVMGAQ
jgi:hypothetical protein